jgi:PAS domain S-box-containing protein
VAHAFNEMASRLQERDTQLATQAAALRDNEARYRAIVEDQTELICRWRPDGTLTFVNGAYCRYFDRTREELIGHSFMPLIPEEDRGIVEQATNHFSPDRAVATYEHRVVLPDGQLRWQQWTDRALFDERGEIVEFASVGRDITERKLAEEALRDSEARLRMALNASHMLAWDFDPQASELKISDNAAEIWGGPIDGLEGTLDVLHPDDKEAMVSFWTNALAQGGEHTTQFRVVQPNNGAIRWMETRGRVTQSAANGLHVNGVIFDITARIEAEEEIRRLNADLEQRVVERTQQLVLANASLVGEVAERKRAEWRSAAFANLAQRLNSALNPTEAAHIIMDTAQDLLGWGAAFLDLYSAEKNLILYNVLMMDTVDGQRKEVPVPDTNYTPTPVVRRTIEEGPQLVLLQDWETEHGELASFGEGEQQTISLMFVPIRPGARTIGVLSIQSYAPGAYDQDDLHTLQALADHCAVALERIEAERALREAEARYRLLVEQIPAVTYIAAPDEGGSTLYISPQIETMLGYSAETWLAHRDIWYRTIHPADMEQLAAEHQHANATGEPCNLVYRLVARDGHTVWVNDQARLIIDQESGARFWQGVMFDITERKQAEEQIYASLREKEVLLKEIHHRVKNNLQVISSLLSLQSRQVTDTTTLELLRESQNRVRSMALIHEKLYQSGDLARVDFTEYVRNLTTHLFRSYKASPAAISLSIETAPDLRLSLDTAIPCGLIVNELVSNALKHAFPDGRAGEINIAFDRAGAEQYHLRVSDNGVGFPDGFDFRQSNSLGLQLVHTLIDQLDGTLEMQRNGGTTFAATFCDGKH